MTRTRATVAAVALAAAVAVAAWADKAVDGPCRGATWASASAADVAACRPPAVP